MADKTKCVMHSETDAIAAVNGSIPVCGECEGLYLEEKGKALPWVEQTFYRQLIARQRVPPGPRDETLMVI